MNNTAKSLLKAVHDGSQFVDANMGVASDVIVATLARPAGPGRLDGRPVPLGRRSLRTAFAAGKTMRFASRVEVSGGLA